MGRTTAPSQALRIVTFLLLSCTLAAGVGLAASEVTEPGPVAKLLPPAIGITTTARLTDPSCAGGKGADLRGFTFASPNYNSLLAVGVSNNGEIVAAQNALSSSEVQVNAFTSDCREEMQFGTSGIAHLGNGGYIAVIVPSNSGGFLMGGGGEYGLVGDMDARGQLVTSFGDHGWVVLPWPGQVTALTQERNGSILVAGETGASCCESLWVGLLSATGRPDLAFGNGGTVDIPPLLDSSIDQLSLAPNGNILVVNGMAHMGCSDAVVSELSPTGLFNEAFQRNFDETIDGIFHQSAATRWSRAFDATLVPGGPRGVAFSLIGDGQAGCLDGSTPTSDIGGLMLRFDSAGNLAATPDAERHFRWPAFDGVVVRPDGGYLVYFPSGGVGFGSNGPSRTQTLEFVALKRSGAVDDTYNDGGYAYVTLPRTGISWPGYFVLSSKNGATIVSSTADGRGLEVFGIRG